MAFFVEVDGAEDAESDGDGERTGDGIEPSGAVEGQEGEEDKESPENEGQVAHELVSHEPFVSDVALALGVGWRAQILFKGADSVTEGSGAVVKEAADEEDDGRGG